MGYSCTAKAAHTLEGVQAVVAQVGEKYGYLTVLPGSNSLPNKGFWEIGRENPDGAITGTIWRPLNAAEKGRWAHLDKLDERVTRAGGFRIEPNGEISRFPGLTKKQRERAELVGERHYRINQQKRGEK
jgi:hypothetical protein